MKAFKAIAIAAALTAGSAFGDVKLSNAVSVSGFIDMSYKQVSPDGGADTKTMTMDQAELDVMLDLGSGLTAQIDLEAMANKSGDPETVNVEQARVDYKVTDMFTLTMGKFDTVIGFEALEPIDMYQYSHALTWDLEPTYHTGILGMYDAGAFNFGIGLVNSLEPMSNPDTNDEMSYLIHAGVAPMEGLSINLNYAAGNEQAGPDDGQAAATSSDVTLLELDASYQMDALLLGFEYVTKEVDNAGTTSENDAMMLMCNYAFTERTALTVRYSQDEDKASNKKTEFTISPSYAITDNWGILLEYRTDTDEQTTPGTSLDSNTLAIETTVSF